MPEELLPKPQTDLPLPEKKLESGKISSDPHPLESHTPIRYEDPHHKHHLLKYFLMGLLFAFAVVAVLGAYFMGMNKSMNQLASISPTPQATPTPEVPLDQKEGFTTFKMPTYSIQAPEEFRRDMNAGNLNTFLSITNYDVATAPGRGFSPTLDKGKLKVEIYESNDIKEFNNLMSKKELEPNTEKIDINGVPAIKTTSDDGIVSILIKNPDKDLVYSINFFLDFSNFKGIAYEIYSTFRFNDSKSQTSTQKYLEIPEFKVKIPITDANKDAYAVIKTVNGFTFAELRVHSLDSEKYCNDESSGGLAFLNKVSKDKLNEREKSIVDTEYAKLIGNYYYYIEGSQAVCTQDKANLNIEVKARGAFLNAVKNITVL